MLKATRPALYGHKLIISTNVDLEQEQRNYLHGSDINVELDGEMITPSRVVLDFRGGALVEATVTIPLKEFKVPTLHENIKIVYED